VLVEVVYIFIGCETIDANVTAVAVLGDGKCLWFNVELSQGRIVGVGVVSDLMDRCAESG
jgi:hypothetical protein